MTIDINWTDLLETLPDEAPTRELIPPDTYTVKVDKAEAGLVQGGNGMINLTLKVYRGQVHRPERLGSDQLRHLQPDSPWPSRSSSWASSASPASGWRRTSPRPRRSPRS